VSDDALRNACFLSLDVLRATHGDDLPYRGALEYGFSYRGGKVPFLSPYKGIYRASVQEGAAALSINTSFKSKYNDLEVDEGLLYAYRDGPIDQPDNRALRSAFVLRAPVVYFQATSPGRYVAQYPYYVVGDNPRDRHVLVAPGQMVGPIDEREPRPIEDTIERRYAVRAARVRQHQSRFRGHVLHAYDHRCAVCRLREAKLLDAAHIVADAEERGEPVVPNGLSLCSIHHRAFDENLVGISPDYTVRVSPKLLDDEDGPMLELLKGFHQATIELPSRRTWRPDRERLAKRFDRFSAASG
jgi:putative restriction endonuclease